MSGDTASLTSSAAISAVEPNSVRTEVRETAVASTSTARRLLGTLVLLLGFSMLGLIPLFTVPFGVAISPLQASALRLAVAALLLSPVVLFALARAGANSWLLITRGAPSGFVIAAATSTYQIAITTIPVSLAIMLVLACMIVVAATRDARRPPVPQLVTFAIALGLAVLHAYPLDSTIGAAPLGMFMACLCGAVFGLLPISLRRAEGIATATLNGIQFAVGTAGLLALDTLLSLLSIGHPWFEVFAALPATLWPLVIVAGVLTVLLPYGAIAWGRRAAGASDLQVALASACEPVVAVAIAATFLGQQSGVAVWLALASVVALNALYPLIVPPASRG